MTTSHTRTLVSLASVTIALRTLGACVQPSSQLRPDQAPVAVVRHRTVPFENNAKDYVHVYLVGDQRQWYLGRVEQGARVALLLPDETLAPGAGLMRLVVVVG